jgi:hypothetical protein
MDYKQILELQKRIQDSDYAGYKSPKKELEDANKYVQDLNDDAVMAEQYNLGMGGSRF